MFAFYQKMTALRNKHYPQALIYGSFAAVEAVDGVSVPTSAAHNERFISITNLSAQHLPYTPRQESCTHTMPTLTPP